MLSQAFEYLQNHLGKAEKYELDDGPVFDRRVHRPPQPEAPPKADVLIVGTLRSLAGYCAANVDSRELSTHLVHVENPQVVRLCGPLRDFHLDRNKLLSVVSTPSFQPRDLWDRWVLLEDAVLHLMRDFIHDPDDDWGDLLELLKSVQQSQTEIRDDDGMAQEVTAKVGVGRPGWANVKNPWTLTPRVTFPEIEQPRRDFVVRLKATHDGPAVRFQLCEPDGDLLAVARIGDKITDLFDALGVSDPPAVIW